MRKTDSNNQIWYEESNGGYQIGFTKSFLDTLDQCWHILPAHTERFKPKAPLLTIETSESMFSILSPISGYIEFMEDRAMNFPDKLTEDDVVMRLFKEVQHKPEPAVGINELLVALEGMPVPVGRGGAFVNRNAPRRPQEWAVQPPRRIFDDIENFNEGNN